MNNKGFFSAVIILTGIIITIILFNSSQLIQAKETTNQIIPKINNYVSGIEIDLKNYSYDCNWERETTQIMDCIEEGREKILKEKTNNLVLCKTLPSTLIDENKFEIKLICENKMILDNETQFKVQKTIILTRPPQEKDFN